MLRPPTHTLLLSALALVLIPLDVNNQPRSIISSWKSHWRHIRSSRNLGSHGISYPSGDKSREMDFFNFFFFFTRCFLSMKLSSLRHCGDIPKIFFSYYLVTACHELLCSHVEKKLSYSFLRSASSEQGEQWVTLQRVDVAVNIWSKNSRVSGGRWWCGH